MAITNVANTHKKIVKPNLNNVINLTSHGSCHSYSLSTISSDTLTHRIAKATLIFPYLIAFHSTANQNIYHYTHLYLEFFCCVHHSYSTAANKREKNEMEYKNFSFFRDYFCAVCIRPLPRKIRQKFDTVFRMRVCVSMPLSNIDRLSACYLAVFHLQFIKINSYRYVFFACGLLLLLFLWVQLNKIDTIDERTKMVYKMKSRGK